MVQRLLILFLSPKRITLLKDNFLFSILHPMGCRAINIPGPTTSLLLLLPTTRKKCFDWADEKNIKGGQFHCAFADRKWSLLPKTHMGSAACVSDRKKSVQLQLHKFPLLFMIQKDYSLLGWYTRHKPKTDIFFSTEALKRNNSWTLISNKYSWWIFSDWSHFCSLLLNHV